MSQTDYGSIAGGDALPDARTLIFRGISGIECEDFIRSVRLIARAEDKDEDDRWMLRFATTRLSGRAMRWHVKLDKEIRKDWDLLVQALLDEYPLDSEEELTAEAVTAAVIPSRASPPEPDLLSISPSRNLTSGILIGRIRVVPVVGTSHQLYLSRDMYLADSKADAVHVQILGYGGPQSIGGINMKILSSIVTKYPQLFLWKDTSTTGWTGRVACTNGDYTWLTNHWHVSSNGTIEVTRELSGTEARYQVVAVGLVSGSMAFVENFAVWTQTNSNSAQHYEARLLFELLFD